MLFAGVVEVEGVVAPVWVTSMSEPPGSIDPRQHRPSPSAH
jgi:hypothetical protein